MTVESCNFSDKFSEKIEPVLKRKAISITPLRMQIARILLGCEGRVTAHQIWAHGLVRKSGQRAALGTVHRTLNVFASHGIVRRTVDQSRVWYYEMTDFDVVVPELRVVDDLTGECWNREITEIISVFLKIARLKGYNICGLFVNVTSI